MNILHIDSSIMGLSSVSRRLSKAIIDRLSHSNKISKVDYRDLALNPIDHLNYSDLGVLNDPPGSLNNQNCKNAILSEFLDADVIVIGVALYNLSIPSQLKAWIDRIVVVNRTFRYASEGAVGLAGGKHVMIAVARGGVYEGNPASMAQEHAENYLRSIFRFIGVNEIAVVSADGVSISADQREASIRLAERKIEMSTCFLSKHEVTR